MFNHPAHERTLVIMMTSSKYFGNLNVFGTFSVSELGVAVHHAPSVLCFVLSEVNVGVFNCSS